MGEHRHYRNYVLAALTVASVLNIADRLILSILLEDIKKAFTLSDTQIGLITGLAFTVFYITFGIPIAWLADRKNRKTIVALSIAAWSLMTALCGAAVGFWSLFIARMGVGIGESGSGPAGMSLLSDYFRRHELGRAVGFYALGSTIGTAAGLMVGGYFAELLGWRMAFVMLGVPGVLFALLVMFTVKEPERGRYHFEAVPALKSETLGAGLRSWLATVGELLGNRLYVGVTLAYACMIVIGYAFATWLASIILRNFPVSKGEVGFYLGLAFLLGGIPGPILGGYLTDFLAGRNPKWRAWLPAAATLLCLPVYYLCLASTSFWWFLGIFSCGYLIFLIAQPPTLSLLQLAVKPDQRAMALAVALLFNNLIGQALGSFLIGLTSTRLAPTIGTHSLPFAVMAVSIGFGLPGALLYMWTARQIVAEPDRRAA